MTKLVNSISLGDLLALAEPDQAVALHDLTITVKRRGGGIAVFENQDLGHPELGSLQFATFGHPDALFETDEVPERLPDINGAINWRYQLKAVWSA